MGLLKEFKEFAVKGNVIDLAVGVIIGAAFNKIVESVVNRSFTLSVPGRTYRYFQDIVAFSGMEQSRVHVQGSLRMSKPRSACGAK